MQNSDGALLQTILLLGVRFCDLLSLLLASQVEKFKETSATAVSDEVICLQ